MESVLRRLVASSSGRVRVAAAEVAVYALRNVDGKGMCRSGGGGGGGVARVWYSAQTRSSALSGSGGVGGGAPASGRRQQQQRGGGGGGGGSDQRGESTRFEPIQGLAAKKFTPKNRNVVSVVKDLTGGQATRTIFRNAMLSLDAKKRLRDLHASDPDKNSTAELAKRFKVSEERVLAIIALGDLRDRYYEENGGDGVAPPLNEALNVGMERWFGCVYNEGDGEKNVEMTISEPRFRVGDMVFGNLAAGRAVRRGTGSGAATPKSSASVAATRLERFRERLDWNMRRTGATISRQPRHGMDIKRPKDGWSIVVTPSRSVRKARDGVDEQPLMQPYVARRDGSRRDLTDDEMLYLRRMKPTLRGPSSSSP